MDIENNHLIDDSLGITKSDLEWLRKAREVITQETFDWLHTTKQVITIEMLIKLKKQEERNSALVVFFYIGGGLMAAIGFDRVVKIGKSILLILGNEK
jgi:hypothetical protein